MSRTSPTTLDTRSFDAVMNTRAELVREYNRIDNEINRIINRLLQDWNGQGADAFRADADRVRTNIGSIQDILKTMTDTLLDCREIIGMTDRQLGDVNSDPFAEE